MAHKIVVDIIDPADGEIKVTHTFWSKKGQNAREAEATARLHYTHHLAACEYFLEATENGMVIEEEFAIPDEEIPEAEEDEDLDDDDPEIVCATCGKNVDDCACS
jgi:hypothetical protein